CYNRDEETAATVIGFIPIFGWVYNAGRSIAYAAKNCPKVALGALRDFTIDAALDIVTWGASTVIRTGLSVFKHSVFLWGRKAAFTLGVKAGFRALKREISHNFIRHGVTSFMKVGLKKNLKIGLSRIKLVFSEIGKLGAQGLFVKAGKVLTKKGKAMIKAIPEERTMVRVSKYYFTQYIPNLIKLQPTANVIFDKITKHWNSSNILRNLEDGIRRRKGGHWNSSKILRKSGDGVRRRIGGHWDFSNILRNLEDGVRRRIGGHWNASNILWKLRDGIRRRQGGRQITTQ
ncbi:unnamed protein product, partial [Owenia fusiformis]